MPKATLKRRGPLERIAVAEWYTTQDLSHLFSVSILTVQKWIDKGLIKGIRLPNNNPQRRERRVHHKVLLAFVRANPDHEYCLDKLEGDLDFLNRDPRKEVKIEPSATAAPRAARKTKDRSKNTWDW